MSSLELLEKALSKGLHEDNLKECLKIARELRIKQAFSGRGCIYVIESVIRDLLEIKDSIRPPYATIFDKIDASMVPAFNKIIASLQDSGTDNLTPNINEFVDTLTKLEFELSHSPK